jgi:uncharacterized protein YerC
MAKKIGLTVHQRRLIVKMAHMGATHRDIYRRLGRSRTVIDRVMKGDPEYRKIDNIFRENARNAISQARRFNLSKSGRAKLVTLIRGGANLRGLAATFRCDTGSLKRYLNRAPVGLRLERKLKENARAATITAARSRSPWNEKIVPKILAVIKAGRSLREATPKLGVNYSRLTGFVRTHPELRKYKDLVRRNSFASSQRKNSAFGDPEICQIAELIKRGKTRKSIADELGVSRATVEKAILKHGRLRRLRGLVTRSARAALSQSRQKLTEQDIPRVRQLLLKNHSIKTISEQLALDRSTLSAFVRRHPQLRNTRPAEMYVAIASTFSGPYFKLGVTRSDNRDAYYGTHHAAGAFVVIVRFKAPALVEWEYHNKNIRWNDFRGARRHEFYKLFLKGKLNPAFVELARIVKFYSPQKNLIRAVDKLLSGKLPFALRVESRSMRSPELNISVPPVVILS